MNTKKNNKFRQKEVVPVVENGDPPKIITQMILPFLVSFLICVIGIAAFAAAFRNTTWFSGKTRFAFMKQAEQLQEGAIIGDSRQELEVYSNLYVDPFVLTQLIDSGSHKYTLVDLRDKEYYDHEHIKTAINIPYAKINEEKILSQQPVILYSYTQYSQDTVKAAIVLLQRGVQTKILKVGWNDWRYFSNLWIPEPVWSSVKIENYLEGDGS